MSATKAALLEIVTLNEELRKVRRETVYEFRNRENELVTRIEVQDRVIESQRRGLAELERRLSEVPTTQPQRHVADEMGLREGRSIGAEATLDGMREGMAKSSGLVAEKEPDQK